ncbi:Type 1 glutamine amidotransferase-like domain-containing protein [Faecalimonas sp.]
MTGSSILILTSQGIQTYAGSQLIQIALNYLGKSFEREKILFVAYHTDIEKKMVVKACIRFGFLKENIILLDNLEENPKLISEISYVYVGEGNVFETLNYIKQKKTEFFIRRIIENGGVYIGSSAGAMVAGDDIILGYEFERNIPMLQDLKALGLFSGTIIPHYSYKNLKQFEKTIDSIILQKYEKIYSVNDEEVLLIKIENRKVCLTKRFRLNA